MDTPKSLIALISRLGLTLARKATPQSVPPPTQQPLSNSADLPQPFGYKTIWFALPTSDIEKVAAAFGLHTTVKANWESGLYYLEPPYKVDYDSNYGRAFVASPDGVWTIVIVENSYDTGPSELQKQLVSFLNELSLEFGEAQYFASYRVVDLAAWIRVVDGKTVRGLVYAGGGLGYTMNIGKTTKEELSLGLRDISDQSPEELNLADMSEEDFENDHFWPNEEDPALLAGHWSINPLKFDQMNLTPSSGILGLLDVKERSLDD